MDFDSVCYLSTSSSTRDPSNGLIAFGLALPVAVEPKNTNVHMSTAILSPVSRAVFQFRLATGKQSSALAQWCFFSEAMAAGRGAYVRQRRRR